MPQILTLNGGSSSVRFAVYEVGGGPLTRTLAGKIERIGLNRTQMVVREEAARPLSSKERHDPVAFLLDWLAAQPFFSNLTAAGHRVVHGMQHAQPELVTAGLLKELRRIVAYDPDHLPLEIELMQAFHERHPHLKQVACFDTAFHRTMPEVAKLHPIPRKYQANGIERFGFHGLSYTYLLEELARLDPKAHKGRVILAHLGNGASLAAVRRGKSIDTSMGFTPTSGLMMGTRTGDVDPGLLYYLARAKRMTPARLQRMANHESGLLGVSGSSSDMRELLAREDADEHAAQAVELFCYQTRKWIGGFAAALGGLDTLVFSGGIGENSPVVRERICEGLEFLGVRLRNGKSTGRVKVRVIRTDEELMIARSACRLLALT